ncbi:hypothetical protein PINS_up001633 [Pythium insidiosum]|nr:hypothetical protein PINS_up001633 [Pythium insidiosum]
MADYEGYLLLHDRGCTADPLYFELEGGLLQYYSKKNGKWLGQFSMTRHRVTARPVKNPSSPNRFVVDFCPVRSIHDTERSMHQFPAHVHRAERVDGARDAGVDPRDLHVASTQLAGIGCHRRPRRRVQRASNDDAHVSPRAQDHP